MTQRNYYEVLEINNSDDSEAIHLAYKRLSKLFQNSNFSLLDYVLKMQEINKAYLTLVDEEKRTKYDEEIEDEYLVEDSDEESQNVEIPHEIDEDSAKSNNVRIESCSFFLDGGGDIEAIGEIVSTSKKDINEYLKINLNAYDKNNKLIGTTKTYGNKSGKRTTFDEYIFIKPKSAKPSKVKLCFVK